MSLFREYHLPEERPMSDTSQTPENTPYGTSPAGGPAPEPREAGQTARPAQDGTPATPAQPTAPTQSSVSTQPAPSTRPATPAPSDTGTGTATPVRPLTPANPGGKAARPAGADSKSVPAWMAQAAAQAQARQASERGTEGTQGQTVQTGRPSRRRHTADGDGSTPGLHTARSAAVEQAKRKVGVPMWLILVAIAAIVILLVAFIIVAVRACSPAPEPEPAVTPTTQQWTSPYDWENLVTLDNGYLGYYVDGQLASEAGVDVSEHDGTIDWAAVKASGIDFAMIRLGYRGYSQGSINLDPYFLANIEGASQAGLKVGVYFFSQAISEDEAREEAQFVLNTLGSLNVTLSYPIAFDQEPITNGDVARTDNLTNAQLTANAVAFCQAIEAAGYQPMVYGNQHDLGRLDLSGALSSYEVWYAEYGVSEPTGKVNFAMWQYTASGTVPGMDNTQGQADINIRFLAE